jgi:hypothetical protein
MQLVLFVMNPPGAALRVCPFDHSTHSELVNGATRRPGSLGDPPSLKNSPSNAEELVISATSFLQSKVFSQVARLWERKMWARFFHSRVAPCWSLYISAWSKHCHSVNLKVYPLFCILLVPLARLAQENIISLQRRSPRHRQYTHHGQPRLYQPVVYC